MHVEPCRRSQRGVVILLLLAILVIGATVYLVTVASNLTVRQQAGNRTQMALAQAKRALIAYAVQTKVTFNGAARPGDLPCPDLDNDGDAEVTSCGNAAGSNQARRLGRLPWRTLGLPDLRDGYGERLWYAVSNRYKRVTRTAQLNSDTYGTIAVRGSDGSVVHNATDATAAIAVIIAPGPVLTRQGSTNPQDHSCTEGVDCNTKRECTVSSAPLCDPTNYLDVVTGVEDNAAFVDAGAGNDGFITGPIRDDNGDIIVNDEIVVVTYQDLMPEIERRVAQEVAYCLREYAANNSGHYPWAAPVSDLSYADAANTLFGRLPATPFDRTKATNSALSTSWGGECNVNTGAGWFANNGWQNLTFYVLADGYSPASPTPSCGTCLTANSFPNRQAVVILAGQALGVAGQSDRAAHQDDANMYLEGANVLGGSAFEEKTLSTTFNDRVVFLPPWDN